MGDEFLDLRSDTVTLPTDDMRKAMYKAEVGDSMRRDLNPDGEDPTINKLEATAAEKMGKEAAMFVASGTMGNLACLMSHTHPGDEVIFEADAHTYYYEVGSFAAIAGLSPRLVEGKHGLMVPADIEAAIRPSSPYFPTPRLFCTENTHNRGAGNAIRPEEMAAMAKVAREHGLAVHLDGARIFNAAVALDVDVKELAQYADSVMFCLSKGLSAPVGSMVAGSREFIDRARKVRKMLGGDMRQSGFLAAAGIIALEKMVERLAEDHRNAAMLAEGLKDIPHIVLDVAPVPTNMVFVETTELGIDATEFVGKMRKEAVLCAAQGPARVRMVTHRHIAPEHIEQVIEAVRIVAQ